jgi:gliding motility-associated lipoprotein GldH
MKKWFLSPNTMENSNKPSFTFTIEDTVSAYHIFVIFRHEDSYHFNNLWLNISTQAPRDTVKTQLSTFPCR